MRAGELARLAGAGEHRDTLAGERPQQREDPVALIEIRPSPTGSSTISSAGESASVRASATRTASPPRSSPTRISAQRSAPAACERRARQAHALRGRSRPRASSRSGDLLEDPLLFAGAKRLLQ